MKSFVCFKTNGYFTLLKGYYKPSNAEKLRSVKQNHDPMSDIINDPQTQSAVFAVLIMMGRN